MGHEMGHYVLNHIPKDILFFFVVIAIGFAMLRWTLDWCLARWGESWQIRGVADEAVIPLVFLLTSIYFFVLTPIVNTHIRTTELEADMYGLNASRQPDGAAQGAIHLGEYRKMSPGPVEEWIFYDHPSGRTRIYNAMRWKAENLQLFETPPKRLAAQAQQPVWSDAEKPIFDQLRRLRSQLDDVRATTTRQLALQIRALPAGPNKLNLALDLAGLSTEGDFGHDTLQEVTTTLADAIRENPPAGQGGEAMAPYIELASLVRCEHVKASLDAPQFAAAMSKLEADDERLEHTDFTLTDIEGKAWTLSGLRGKVVLVNFWATWCPPCRKEMPDLESFYERFKDQGFVILAISDEDVAKVKPFIAQRSISYTILLDPGRKVNKLFAVDGIPKSFVYDRDGKLVAESIDMRTRNQFLAMLAQAGLQ
jgi:peroxiredoxin